MSALATVAENIWNDLDVVAQLNAPLGPLTWYRSGGPAQVLISPRTIDALQILCKRCHENGIALRVLGSGANVLVADDGVEGVVVRLDASAFQLTAWQEKTSDQPTRIGAGVDLMTLVQESPRRAVTGLSQLAGIPATVGGAVRMNAGGAYGDTAQSIHSIELLTMSGEIRHIPAAQLHFAYRHCELPDGIILAANWMLTPGDGAAIREHVKEVFAYKSRTQPMADHSAGCMFKNPIDPATGKRTSAGKLIDLAGLKGHEIGGAFVSQRHGNFIGLKTGGAANDVLALAVDVQQRVFDHSGILLEREVVVWSESFSQVGTHGCKPAWKSVGQQRGEIR